jgi:hypothetical protein
VEKIGRRQEKTEGAAQPEKKEEIYRSDRGDLAELHAKSIPGERAKTPTID